MSLIVVSLERKNLCYRSFYKLCEIFLDEISAGNISNLGSFQSKRQALLDTMDTLETLINSELASLSPERKLELQGTNELGSTIQTLLREKDSIVNSILIVDKEILRALDRIKDDTLQKIHSIQSGRRTVHKYKSSIDTIERAEGLKIVDDEV